MEAQDWCDMLHNFILNVNIRIIVALTGLVIQHIIMKLFAFILRRIHLLSAFCRKSDSNWNNSFNESILSICLA